jgi:transposase
MTELDHAGFRNLVLITDRGYESLKNIELYISKRQNVITCVKVSQGEVLKIIKSIDLSSGVPAGMKYSKDKEVFYAQYDSTYSVKGNGRNVIEADRLKINLYYSPAARANAIVVMQNEIEEQKSVAEEYVASGQIITDEAALAKQLNLLALDIDVKTHSLKGFTENADKRNARLLTSGFFASKTIGMDIDPIEAMNNYGMRDEQEKCFQLQKRPLNQDRTRCWSESAKHGRMFVCFIGLILASYVRFIWKSDDYLSRKFGSTEDIFEEMRPIRCIEHKGRLKFITPFVGDQVQICRAFGFDIPDGAAPTYISKTPSKTGRRGRPANPRTESQEI